MTNELTVLNALQSVLIANVNQYLTEGWTQLTSKNVILEWPEVEAMTADATVFINGNYAEYEELATINDASTFTVSVFLMVKKDTKSNLTTKLYTYFNGIYQAIRKSMDLNHTVDFTMVTDADFYPAIEANKNVQGVEISCAVHYTKDF